jgi:DNA-binding NarL/FixJ family response regulator
MSRFFIFRESFHSFKSQYKDHDKESVPNETNILNYPLTNKEMEIIMLIVDGLSNKEIAAKLYTAAGTVRNTIQAF